MEGKDQLSATLLAWLCVLLRPLVYILHPSMMEDFFSLLADMILKK